MKLMSIFSCIFFAGTSFAQIVVTPPADATNYIRNEKQYSDIVKILEELAATNADVSLFELGESDSGATIKGIKVGHGPLHNLVVGTHHGNEYGATEVAQAFAESAASNPIAGQTLHIIPVLNIQGYNQRNRREMASGRTHDPNRDYPAPCGDSNPWKLKSTKALDTYIKNSTIVTAITLHTYSSLILYPWGGTMSQPDTGYTDVFERMGAAGAYLSGYGVGNSRLELYAANGVFQDYVFDEYGAWPILFELGTSHYPNYQNVQRMIQENVPGIRKLLEEAPQTRATDHKYQGECYAFSSLLDFEID